jgi:DNA-binding transcriptional ArsR family regulator
MAPMTRTRTTAPAPTGTLGSAQNSARAQRPRSRAPGFGAATQTEPATAAAQVAGPDVAALAALLADSTRAQFCLALLDGRAWTAGELARHADVAASTATAHLNLLVDGGLLAQERQGRNRYLRLSGPDAAELIEHLAVLAPRRTEPPRTLSAASRNRALARARTCYDHLAGTLGVSIADAMTDQGLLDWSQGLALTAPGVRWLAELGLDLPAGTRRPPVRACLDWTERRPHLAGSLGAALCRLAFERGWITRIGTGRAVAVTEKGVGALHQRFGIAAADGG